MPSDSLLLVFRDRLGADTLHERVDRGAQASHPLGMHGTLGHDAGRVARHAHPAAGRLRAKRRAGDAERGQRKERRTTRDGRYIEARHVSS